MGKRNLFCKRYWLFYLQVALLDLNKQDFIVLKLVTDRCVLDYSAFIFFSLFVFFFCFFSFFVLLIRIRFGYEMREKRSYLLFLICSILIRTAENLQFFVESGEIFGFHFLHTRKLDFIEVSFLHTYKFISGFPFALSWSFFI